MSDWSATFQTTPKRGPLLAPTPAKLSQPIKVNKPTPARRKFDLSDEKVSHSCPPDVFRPPPKPRPGPMTAETEPPPIELPPSPPVFAAFSYDVDDDNKGRSLNEFRWSMSMPNSYQQPQFHSSFHDIITEKPEEEAVGTRMPTSSSYSETSDRPTIFNLMQDTASPIPATSSRSWIAVKTASKSRPQYPHGADYDPDGSRSPSIERRPHRHRAETGEDLQFDLTLDSDTANKEDLGSWADDGSTLDDGRASFGLQY